MKTFRHILLIVLALLLPLRGALAHAMPCEHHPAPHGVHHAAHRGVHHAAQHAPDAAVVHHDGASCASSASHAGSCGLCAACGSVTPLPVVLTALDPPAIPIAFGWPAPMLPPASFESGGVERPPRRG